MWWGVAATSKHSILRWWIWGWAAFVPAGVLVPSSALALAAHLETATAAAGRSRPRAAGGVVRAAPHRHRPQGEAVTSVPRVPGRKSLRWPGVLVSLVIRDGVLRRYSRPWLWRTLSVIGHDRLRM